MFPFSSFESRRDSRGGQTASDSMSTTELFSERRGTLRDEGGHDTIRLEQLNMESIIEGRESKSPPKKNAGRKGSSKPFNFSDRNLSSKLFGIKRGQIQLFAGQADPISPSSAKKKNPFSPAKLSSARRSTSNRDIAFKEKI